MQEVAAKTLTELTGLLIRWMAQNFVHGVPQFCVSITVQHKGVSPTWST
jgi:hypothetical protein